MKKNMLVKLAMALTVVASVSSLAFADGNRGGGDDGRGGGPARGGGDDGRGGGDRGGDRGGDSGWHPQQPPPPPYYGPQPPYYPPQPPPVYYPPQPPPEQLYTCWVTAASDGRQYEGQSYNYVEARNIAIEYCKDAGESNVDCDEPSDMWCNN